MKIIFASLFIGLALPASALDFSTQDFKWSDESYRVDRKAAGDNPFVALKKLLGGNKRFLENKSVRPRQDFESLRQLESSQSPFAIIVGCSDSRVPNEIIFDQGLGDLFIIRTAGQVSSAASYGSMEFAATALRSRLLVVLGHTECGAVAAAVKRPKNVPGHIVTLINEIKPSAKKCEGRKGDHVENTVRQNVIDQVENLRGLEPTLSELYQSGQLLIVGAIYDINTGVVEYLPETLTKLPETFARQARQAK